MVAIFLFYLPFSFYHADMLVNNAGVSENELQGLKKTAVFSDTNKVGTLSGRHFTLRCTTLLLFRVQAVKLRMPNLQFTVGPDLTPLDVCGITQESNVHPKLFQHYQPTASLLGYNEQEGRLSCAETSPRLIRLPGMDSHVRTTLGRVQHTDCRREYPFYKQASAEKNTHCNSGGRKFGKTNLGHKTTRVGTLKVATIYSQLIQNRYMFRSFTVFHCSHQHCVQPVASDVEVVGCL